MTSINRKMASSVKKPLDASKRSAADRAGEQGVAYGLAEAEPVAAGASVSAPNERHDVPSLLPLTTKWIVISHRPFEGPRVRFNVRREGFEVHWPRIIERRARRDDVIRPFFPGYMFAHAVEPRASWHVLKSSVPNVVAIMGVAEQGRPVFAPAGFVEALIAKAGGSIAGVIEPQEDVIPAWCPGQAVRISGGQLDGFRGLYKHDKAGDRVAVLLEIMGRQTTVTLARKGVEAA